jgi:hypothetical protein
VLPVLLLLLLLLGTLGAGQRLESGATLWDEMRGPVAGRWRVESLSAMAPKTRA